jgi:hypothetical protein
VEAAGDEAFLHATRLSGVSVWVGANRVEQVRAARDAGATVVILDDGFQHRKLHRDMDILLASPAHLVEGAPLLPEGVLREPPGCAARADIIGGFGLFAPITLIAKGAELEQGFDAHQAASESNRCLQCGLICYLHDSETQEKQPEAATP